MTMAVYSRLAILMIFLISITSCAPQQADDTPGVSDDADAVDTINLPQPDHKAFIGKLRKDCLKLSTDQDFLATVSDLPSDEVNQNIQHYCTCFISEFTQQFTAKDLDEFLGKDKALDPETLDNIAEDCSIHLE